MFKLCEVQSGNFWKLTVGMKLKCVRSHAVKKAFGSIRQVVQMFKCSRPESLFWRIEGGITASQRASSNSTLLNQNVTVQLSVLDELGQDGRNKIDRAESTSL